MIDFFKSLCFKAIIDEIVDLRKQLSINDINIFESKNRDFAHFQLNNIIRISKDLNLDSLVIAERIKHRIESMIGNEDIKITISGKGFINFSLNNKYISNNLLLLVKSLKCRIKKTCKIILDYSSPNIAKNMHIGHLRSTVVGACLAKLLVFSGCKVLRISHLGDWGTQFGLLIAYLKMFYGNTFFNKKFTLHQLSDFYQAAQLKFKNDESFSILARNEVVNLQNKNYVSFKFWKIITLISKKEYNKIYTLLNVKLKYKGESFYCDLLKPLVNYLFKKNLIKISNGAKCIYFDNLGYSAKNFHALIVQKFDGGYNYATTEIATLYYRMKYYLPDKIIYVTDIGQSLHFDMIFKLVSYLKFGLKKNIDLIHVPLGLMLNKDGKKIRTRSGESEKLLDVLFTSIRISKNIILEKNSKINLNRLNNMARILGINTIKYSDLSNKLDQNYVFDKEKVFKNTGNTATFLMYAYVRICSIKKKLSNLKFKNLFESCDIFILEKSEIELGISLLMYKHFINLAASKLDPNILTSYTYRLAEKFHIFFHECNIKNSSSVYSRFILCEIVRRVLKICFDILGLKVIDKM